MMKLIFFGVFLSGLMKINKLWMYYHNLCFLGGFFSLFMYMYKFNGLQVILMSGYFGADSYSFFLVLLTLWVIGLMFMALSFYEYHVNMYLFNFLLVIMMCSFGSSSFILFYLFFEISLVPTFIIIVLWGSNLERLSASMYLLMYTMIISLPLLIYIFKMYVNIGSLSIVIMSWSGMKMSGGIWGYLMLFLAFYIKLPLYGVHIWLPKAHVEAPVYGSMILAAVLLKLGGYGLIRLFMVYIDLGVLFNYIIFSVGVVGMLIVGVICLMQVDMKSLIAYSSVVHMNMMMCSLLTMMSMGLVGSYLMMIVHGVCSSSLFYMVGVFYKRSGSRLLLLNKGILNFMGGFKSWWFYLCMANFSFPFSLGFISEFLMLMVLVEWEGVLLVYCLFIFFFSGAYSLYLFSWTYHGVGGSLEKFNSGEVKELIVLIGHSYPVLLFLLNASMFF